MDHIFPTLGEGLWAVNLTAIGTSVLAALVVLLLARLAVANIDVRRPRGIQNFFEWVVDFITGLAKDTIGDRAMTYVPLAFTLIIYLFVANQMGLITNVVTHVHEPMLGISAGTLEEHHGVGHVSWFMSPTANLSVAMAMSIGIVGMTHIIGLRNPRQYFKHYFEPNPAFFILHLIDELAKFLTLGLRLYGNIFAGEVLIAILLGIPLLFGIIPLGGIPMIIWIAYSIFVGTIQAFVFTVLTLVYISQKLPHKEAH
ncbi:ATP synthase F0 subunit A [Tumebacillus avium]|uniref:ATP synthase subunit a n=1 Tax=Tumebacillus avium TaxID=1903704 RepID=A0A1Y0IL26_9BACL|nr:F0F1 ATP synthase subunit A [Tumebacillus avium]ARU60536.1 ATP synthase F0 subunit A [Tumebacillus avium]